MATTKPTTGAIQRRVVKVAAPPVVKKPPPPAVPNRTGQVQTTVPKTPAGYYKPGAKDTSATISKKYGITPQQLSTLNPGYKMSAGFGPKANLLKVRGYAKPLPGAPKVAPTQPAPNPATATGVDANKPPNLSIEEWLGLDQGYGEFQSSAGLNKSQFLESLTRQRNEAGTTKEQALRDLALQNPKNRESLSEEYAARGMSESGVMGNALYELSNQYNKQQGDVNSAYTKTLADLDEEEQGYNFDAEQALTAAKQAAIRRRAAKYGLEE
jgi:hypothetical protein